MEPSPGTAEAGTAAAPQNGGAPAGESFEVHRPTDGSVIESVAIDPP